MAGVSSRTIRGALVLLMAAALSACTLNVANLNFRVDHRLHFVTPRDRQRVQTPVVVSWTMRGFTIAAPGSAPPSRHAGYFAIFLDRAPIRPGQTMKAVVSDDRLCQLRPGCPDAAYLAQRYIYITTNTFVRLPFVPNLSDKNKIQVHELTVVLMDTAGHRIGESAWSLSFRLRRVGTA
jgi:hypothetical protein